MKAKANHTNYIRQIILVGIPVILLIASFYIMAEKVILRLSKDKMNFKSDNYSEYMERWSEKILEELEIYKSALETEGEFTEHSFHTLSVSYGPNSAYPYGMYWGDEDANFYDASGWDPGPEYIPASRTWFKEGLNNDRFAFGEPYMDARADRPCVSVTAKMRAGERKSVLAADIYFDYADELIERISTQEIETAFFVSGKNRMIIADSDRNKVGTTLSAEDESPLYRNISRLIDEGSTGLISLNGGRDYVHISRIRNMDWYFVTYMSEKDMLSGLRQMTGYILIVSAIGLVALIFLANRATSQFSAAEIEAKTDPLTGLLNRDGFNSALKTAVRREPNQGVMLMIDVDNFKKVNDELGHTEGDVFLKALSGMITDYFNRDKDVTSRLGGDEFAVFVGRSMTFEEVTAMLERFTAQFHKKFDNRYSEQKLSVSVGAAFVGSNGGDPDKIYKSADSALYIAKNEGKDRFVIT